MNNHKIEILDTLSNEASNLISGLLLKGFSPKEIKEYMEDSQCLREGVVSLELSREIHSFMCNNWEAIQKIGI